MKKRFMALFLALVMCLVLVPTAALAAEETSGTCGDNVTWSLQNGVLTISGTGQMENFYNSDAWHDQRDTITSLVISEGVTSIGDFAFSGCTALTNVTIPDSVAGIGSWAFNGCTG